MYGPILSFVQFVARCVQMHVLPSDGESFRLIVPGSGSKKNSDYAPADSDDNTRIDIGLVGAQVGESITAKRSGDYYAIRAVLEAKRSRGDVEDAFAQLYDYSRHLFSERHNLRFAWGLTVCGVDVRACHFGPDRAVASKPMDVSTAAGRCAFIRLLVEWSLCDDSLLGRDPTIGYMKAEGCWWIDCYDDKDSGISEKTTYYFNTTICIADRLFGRHTRCFPATSVRPTKKLAEGESLKATVVIKDAWAFAKPTAQEDDRDEVKSLRSIRDAFEGGDFGDLVYPEIEVGGRVRFKMGDETVQDTTSTLYKNCSPDLKKVLDDNNLFRAHRRIAMSSMGERLGTVRDVKEFVTVLYDAMRCHHAIVEHCRILHRDISDNNILVVRKGDEPVRGLLIDFDCAVNIDAEKS
ncbi:hypothetical protein IWW38_005620, partial [Coemansia aciculifera]